VKSNAKDQLRARIAVHKRSEEKYKRQVLRFQAEATALMAEREVKIIDAQERDSWVRATQA